MNCSTWQGPFLEHPSPLVEDSFVHVAVEIVDYFAEVNSRVFLIWEPNASSISPGLKQPIVGTFSRVCGNRAISWAVVLLHLHRLDNPVRTFARTIFMRLYDAHRVNPEITYAQFPRNSHGVPESLRQTVKVNASPSFLNVTGVGAELRFLSLRWVSPTMR